jgi:hypothetical protein
MQREVRFRRQQRAEIESVEQLSARGFIQPAPGVEQLV